MGMHRQSGWFADSGQREGFSGQTHLLIAFISIYSIYESMQPWLQKDPFTTERKVSFIMEVGDGDPGGEGEGEGVSPMSEFE